MKWVECVPNFSEGRDPEVIEAIATAIRSVDDVLLLHVDPGWDANRTVYTFVGTPEGVAKAAFRAIKVAQEQIDMRTHSGEHPRMGACDVCPFIPLGEMTMEETARLSHEVGSRLGKEGISVYMYERSANIPERCNLAFLRKGEYEAIAEKSLDPSWKPDYGPHCIDERFGMMALGARPFLVAYNISLDSTDLSIARKVAAQIRESGYIETDGRRIPGLLKGLKAIGWWMEHYHCVQVSTNIVDLNIVGVKTVFDTVVRVAGALGVAVKGSELIGLIPEKALLDVGKELLPDETDKFLLAAEAVKYLGLDLDPESRILEWCIGRKAVQMK